MSWQGIPFKFLSADPVDTVNLALQSIPRIIVDSPTDYTSPIVTGIVSLIAGIIPACIAIWTFKRNSHNTKLEREAQEVFLINERAEQQRFLKEERLSQINSTEKDRETQLVIAKQNFDMQVLSANRQAWINLLRDLIAEYVAISPELLSKKHDQLNKEKYYNEIAKIYTSCSTVEEFQNIKPAHDHASAEITKSIDEFTNLNVRERKLIAKLNMMINPNEEFYADLNNQFKKVKLEYLGLKDIDLDNYTLAHVRLNTCLDVIINISQRMLKNEWDRVKQGV